MASQSFSQVTPHISRLELPLGSSSVAVFLVKGDDGWTLIDTGTEKQVETVMITVLNRTKGVKPVRLILSHGHPDHAGGALKIRMEWRLKVAAGRAEIPYLTEPVFYRKIPAHTPLHYVARLFTLPQMLGRGVDLPLDERQTIAGMTVYHVPGHAPGMVALLHPADRALICSDTFINRNRLTDPGGIVTYDPKLNHKSQKKLAQLDFDHLLPSHGPVIMNDGKRQALALMEKRFGKEAVATGKPALAK